MQFTLALCKVYFENKNTLPQIETLQLSYNSLFSCQMCLWPHGHMDLGPANQHWMALGFKVKSPQLTLILGPSECREVDVFSEIGAISRL